MKDDSVRTVWPLVSQPTSGTPVIIKAFDEIDDLEEHRDRIVVVTDGWRHGPVAAILRGGLSARAVLEVLANSGQRDVKIFHIEEKISQLEDIFLSSVVTPAHTLFDSVTINWRRDPSIYELVKNIGGEYEMLFFGAPLATSEIVPFYRHIKEVYHGSVTIVRAPMVDFDFDEGDEIYRWVRERTFESSDFSLPAVLSNYKKKLGVKVAVILPSLNEEKTVGNVIKTALEVKALGIIDDVILIDSASTDATVEIGRSFGIPVFQHAEIAPELGAYAGKGEAMFKSAFVTEADIMAWVDTDIESITPRFFYGLFGPLLTNASIRFAKGYFARPVRIEASGLELGGGRVTELLARPWINMFLPELSGYIQPLAGTVAIYREDLLRMKIPVNYGVEIAMLIQAVNNGGLWSTCQVNLGEVVHKSKDITGLSEMSFQIMQVLAEMCNFSTKENRQNILRRVYSAHGHIELGSKRFQTVWRDYTEDICRARIR
ncbi:glucosyl-3-phosphoglycerate synthase [Sporolituus thermophilus]|uniref:Glucosyl-3-phosphoglycerate synthase n=1 Tax=Sporolituus thermophilus DSM 23256 TaxID=1123285 RepID=A0A1G7NIC3_9FIRM|nr:glucosyl-3-phosphoglycerate synthase [Sporolituus thermophilus]SDF73702.1 hypothetical protein SAMN05660235_02579 [Sporolituus thermophilus DSM 23256]